MKNYYVLIEHIFEFGTLGYWNFGYDFVIARYEAIFQIESLPIEIEFRTFGHWNFGQGKILLERLLPRSYSG